MKASLDHELLFALCHEMGNLVGAVRLQTHLIDQEMSPRDLVTARSEIDVLGARVSALLSLVRPSVGDLGREHGLGVQSSDVLATVEHGLDTLIAPGVEIVFVPPSEDMRLEIDRVALQALVTSLVHLAVEQVRPEGRVRVGVESRDGQAALVVEDDGPEDPALVAWAEGPFRGRPLVCAVAADLLARCGGELEVASSPQRSRVAIWAPRASG